MTHISTEEEAVIASWIPDLFGPIFRKERFTLQEVLELQDIDEQIHLMATFLPDEIIRGIVSSQKSTRSFRAVILFLNISGFSTLFTKYIHDENMGSLTFTDLLNNYIGEVVYEIYRSDGDVLKLSAFYANSSKVKIWKIIAGVLLAIWKVRSNQFPFDIVQNVIACAICIRNLNHAGHIPKANIAISAGDVILSEIGNENIRDFVIHGAPMDDLKYACKVSQPNDLVLSSSAWRHCVPSRYEYVIKDSRNIKIIKILPHLDVKPIHVSNTSLKTRCARTNFPNKSSSYTARTTFTYEDLRSMSVNVDMKKGISTTAISAITAANPKFITLLKSHLMKLVVYQIEKNRSLDFLTAVRHVTTLSLDIVPNQYTDDEVVLLVNKCYLLVHSIVAQYAGFIDTVNLYEKSLYFRVVFGLEEHGVNNQRQKLKPDNVSWNGITCALQVLRMMKTIAFIYNMSIGISTGLTYCGVIGNPTRKHYAIIGPSVDRASKIMNISYNKISCDYDTMLHSHLKKKQFRSRGLKKLGSLQWCEVYEYLIDTLKQDDPDVISSTEYCYPILGRQQELDEFDDILDEIGVAGRTYSGLLIEGVERSGKSRLLDAFVASVCDRQVRPIQISLHATYAEKAHAVIHHVILQILEAEECDTIEERQKMLLSKLASVVASEDFCYLNDLMRVRFPLSKAYCLDSEWKRHKKTVRIFGTMLKQLNTKICILLDDVHYIDNTSWRFLTSALDLDHVVVAMTMLTNSWRASRTQSLIRGDRRLMKRTLYGLDPELLPALVCQFLNVLAIPKELSRILQECTECHVGWCETYLTSLLQNDALDFLRLSPSEASQRNLVFPDASMLTKLPFDLKPQELPPPLIWSRRSNLNVCDVNERYSEILEINRNTKGLMREIYEKMSPSERSFIACAATLGTVFKRNVLLNMISDMDSKYTDIDTTISKMYSMRILECASYQRSDFHSKDLTLCILKKRKTFSDMRHSVTCNCHLSRQTIVDTFSLFGTHCKMLEFKINLFCKIMYDIQPDIEKRHFHMRAIEIYGRKARKCSFCGGGPFFTIPGEEDESSKSDTNIRTSLVRHKVISQVWNGRRMDFTGQKLFTRRGTLLLAKRREFVGDTRRVSILPTYLDYVEDDDISTISRESSDIGESLTSRLSKFRRRVSSGTSPETARDGKQSDSLDAFGYINYRNCQCDHIISCLFWKLHRHIDNSGEVDLIVGFLIEYSSGLLQLAQPSHAIKLLAIAAERNAKTVEIANNADENDIQKGIILVLTGDAYSALGNYHQAKKYYATALTVRGVSLKTYKVVCYGPLLAAKVHRKLRELPLIDEKSALMTTKRLELASYTRRLCFALMKENKLKSAKLFALRSFKMGFPVLEGFLEKSDIYLTATQISCRIGNDELSRCIEKPMLTIIRTKLSWSNVKEIAMLAKVYFAMYQAKTLKGKLEEAVDLGVKVLRISETLHLNDLLLAIMPSLVEILLWTKRVNQAIDLMAELYFLADEDVDLSAMTWYHALSLELLIDAGVLLEPYETALKYYERFVAYRSKSYVTRDPQSIYRLVTCLCIYQLRMGYTLTNSIICNANTYLEDADCNYDISRIFTCCKSLEYYLLLLLRCANMKDSSELVDRIRNVRTIIGYLDKVSDYARVVKPRLYLLTAYLNTIRGRKSAERFYLRKARKLANAQGNVLVEAWCMQNERTWAEKIYNNMARYWLEYVGSLDFIAWQHICNFSVSVWSTILYPLPIPDTYLS